MRTHRAGCECRRGSRQRPKETTMTVCERMNRERVSLADLDDTEELHVLDDREKVRRYRRALVKGAGVPPLFVIRHAGRLMMIQGSEQIAAAERAGVEALDAIVVHALNPAE